MMDVITINGKDFLPGQSGEVDLNVYQLPTKTDLRIPVYVFRSDKPGPTGLFIAGMHGDEINGIEVLRKLVTRPSFRNPIKGSIIAIPIINVISFLYGSRDLPDGRDLNRCFPGSRSGSLGSQIAYDLMKQVIPYIDFGIDFHTGGSKISNHPQLRCSFEDNANVELAKWFSPPLIINSSYRDNTLRKESAKKGKNILVYEGGESLRFDYLAINEGVNGCMRLLNRLGMINEDIPDNYFVLIQKSTWLRANISGLFHASKVNGAFIGRGEVIGSICNPYGEVENQVISPVDGYIVGVNNMPVVNQGDALVHIGVE